MAKKDTIKTVINRGAIVAKQTKKAPEQGAISAPKQKNIQSAQGNTSNAYESKMKLDKGAHAGRQATWSQTSGDADLYYKSTHNADGSKKASGTSNSIVGKGNKETVETPEWQKRTNAGKKQTEARQPLPSLEDFGNKTVFTGATKHVDDGRTGKERLLDMLEGLAVGTQSYANEITARDFMKDTFGIDPISAHNQVHGNDFTRNGQQISDALYEAKRDEHKVADAAGKMAGKAQEYATVNALAETIPALQTAKEFLTSKLGGSIHAENIANALIDYGITDLPLDTVPEIRENIKAGKNTSEIVTDALKNFGINTAFNLGLGYLGNIGDLVGARRAFKGQKDALQEIAQRGKSGDIQLPNIADDIKPGISNQIVPNELDELVPTERLLDINSSRNALNITRPNVMDELVPNRDTAMQMADSLRQTGWEPQTQQLDMLGNPARQYEVPEPKVYKDTSVDGFRRESTSLRRSVDQYGGDPEKYQNIFKLLNEYQDTGNEDLLKQAHDLSVALDGELTGKAVKRGKATYNYNEGSYITKVDDLIDKLSNSKRYEQFSNTEVTGADLKYPINSLRERASKALDPEGVNKSLDEFISNLNEVVAKNDAESWNKVQESFNKVLQSDATMRSNGEAVAQEMFTMIDRVEDMTKTGAKTAAESVSEPTLTGKLDDAPLRQSEEQALNRYSNVTVPNQPDMPDAVKEALKDNPQVYNVAKNAESSAIADQILASNNFDGAYSQFKQMLGAKEPASVPLGYRLARQAAQEGRTEQAVEIVEAMGSELTKAGQFTQAAAIEMLKDDPMAMLRYTQKQIDKLNAEGLKKYHNKWKNFELTDAEKKAFAELDPGDSDGLYDLTHGIAQRLTDEYPVTMWEKLVEASHTAMLLNPKTHIRNIVSNTAMKPLTSLADRVEGVMQNVYKKFNKDFDVTQSMVGGTKAQKEAAQKIYKEEFDGLLEGVSGSKYNEVNGSEIRRNRQIFKDNALGLKAKDITVKLGDKVSTSRISPVLNKLTDGKMQEILDGLPDNMKGSFMENLRNFDYWLLGAVEDDPFVKSRFTNRLASYMKANNIDDVSSLTGDALKNFNKAKNIAWEEALEATFKDDNFMTTMFSGIKKSLGKGGDVILPFVKTPANIAMRGIDYSPAGFVKAISEGIKGEGADKVIKSLAKATTGTGLVALGYMLRNAGIVRGELSDNKDEKAYQKQQGQLPYSFNVDGVDATFDWAQPAAIPLIVGVTMADAADNPNREWYEHVADATAAAGDAWSDLSPLQTFQDIFTGNGYGDNSITQNIMGEIAEYPQRLIPSIMGATARANDNVYRNTYVPEDARDLTNNYYLNTVRSKLPALGDEDNWWNENVSSQSLPASYDLWGRERQRASSDGLNAFQQFIFPGNMGNDMSTPIDTEINSLNDKGYKVTPHKAEWSYKVNGETIKLDNQTQSDMQRDMGQLSYSLAEDFITSPEYASLSDEQKANVLGNIYTLAENLAKDNNIVEYEYDNKNGYRELSQTPEGRQQILNDFINKEILNDYGYTTSSTKAEQALTEGGVEALDEYHQVDQALKSHGYNASDENIDFINRLPSLDDFEEYAGYLDKNNMKNTANSRNLFSSYGIEGLDILKGSDSDKNGSLKKDDELLPYLKAHGYTYEEANKIMSAINPKWNPIDENWKTVRTKKK